MNEMITEKEEGREGGRERGRRAQY